MNLKCMAAVPHMSDITDLTVSKYKIANGIKILMSPVSTAGDLIPDSFHCYHLHLETLIISEHRHILNHRE